jgi:hypothetical protein
MKKAEASGAFIAVIVGDAEATLGEASVRKIVSKSAGIADRARGQRRVGLDHLGDEVEKILRENTEP